jgi:hypothetical protein
MSPMTRIVRALVDGNSALFRNALLAVSGTFLSLSILLNSVPLPSRAPKYPVERSSDVFPNVRHLTRRNRYHRSHSLRRLTSPPPMTILRQSRLANAHVRRRPAFLLILARSFPPVFPTGARSQLAGGGGVVEGLGCRHTRRVHAFILGNGRAAAALAGAPSRDQPELDALNKYPRLSFPLSELEMNTRGP